MEMAPFSGQQKFTRPTNLLNSIFMSTSSSSDAQSAGTSDQKWRVREHLRLMAMLITWFAVWLLKLLMDCLPCYYNTTPPSNPYTYAYHPHHLSSSPLSSASMMSMSMSIPSITALQRALSQVSSLIKLDEMISTRLHSSLDRTRAEVAETGDSSVSLWVIRLVQALPMGSYLTSCAKTVGTCVNAVISSLANDHNSNPRKMVVEGQVEEIWAEKLAQELLWMTRKLKEYGGVEEAMIQWSYASELASLSLDAHPRVQGFILKISGLLFVELRGVKVKIERGVKFRLLWLWLPLLCHACNGVAYPVLSSYEKAEIERSMEEAIASLPALDQELILSNWFHDYSVSASDWPNLQFSYDRWCQHTRQLVSACSSNFKH